jgi:hypothetical protein
MQTPTRQEVEEYLNAAQSAMFQCQLVEEALKTYISTAHSIIRKSIPRELNFGYADKDFEAMPLERLLTVFGKLTHNKILSKKLNGLRDPRNYVAHKAFALVFLSSVSSKVAFEAEFKKVIAARDLSIEAFMALKDELDSISALKDRVITGLNESLV